MATCNPVDPPRFRIVTSCMNGTWHKREEQEFLCRDGGAPYLEWQPTGDWVDTGAPCG